MAGHLSGGVAWWFEIAVEKRVLRHAQDDEGCGATGR